MHEQCRNAVLLTLSYYEKDPFEIYENANFWEKCNLWLHQALSPRPPHKKNFLRGAGTQKAMRKRPTPGRRMAKVQERITHEAADQLDSLTELLAAQPPGIGRRALKRFFAGRPRSRWAERLDRPGVLWAANAERRALASAD